MPLLPSNSLVDSFGSPVAGGGGMPLRGRVARREGSDATGPVRSPTYSACRITFSSRTATTARTRGPTRARGRAPR